MESSTPQATSFNQTTVDWRRPPPRLNPADARPWPGDTEAIDRFQEDGATLVRGIFEGWVEPLRAGLERNLRAPQDYAFPCESAPAGEPGRFFDSYCNWLLIPQYLDHVTASCAASMAGQLMRSRRAQFFHEHAFCKEPGTQRATPWHQDLPYYCVDGTQTVSLYVSLDEVPAEVAVRFVKGSHRWGRLFYPRVFLGGADFNTHDAALEAVPDIDARPQDYDILALGPRTRRRDRLRLPDPARHHGGQGRGTAARALHPLARGRRDLLPASGRDLASLPRHRARGRGTHAGRLVSGHVAHGLRARSVSSRMGKSGREGPGATARFDETLGSPCLRATIAACSVRSATEHETRVIDSRLADDGAQVRRRRECTSCKERFTTYESAEVAIPRIIKNDGTRAPFDERKLRLGMQRAIEKRPVASDAIEAAIGRIKRRLIRAGEREIASRALGEAVMNALRNLDRVAYVRFASVYRKFEDVSEFRDEVERLESEPPPEARRSQIPLIPDE